LQDQQHELDYCSEVFQVVNIFRRTRGIVRHAVM